MPGPPARPWPAAGPGVACCGAADELLGPDARAVRRDLRGERGGRPGAGHPGQPDGEPGPGRRRAGGHRMARRLRGLRAPRERPLTSEPARQVVLVSGIPAAGKSAIAGPLAAELGFALLGKDQIKETLADALGD